MELKELEKLTVTKLREMAMEYEDIEGASAMPKEKLIEILCDKLGIDREKKPKVAAGVDKTGLKKKIADLKELRAQAMTGGNRAAADQLRRRIHHAKRRTRKAVVKAS